VRRSHRNILAATLTEGQIVTLNTQTFTVQLAGGAKIKDARNRIATILQLMYNVLMELFMF
jgi:hypothetical protein